MPQLDVTAFVVQFVVFFLFFNILNGNVTLLSLIVLSEMKASTTFWSSLTGLRWCASAFNFFFTAQRAISFNYLPCVFLLFRRRRPVGAALMFTRFFAFAVFLFIFGVVIWQLYFLPDVETLIFEEDIFFQFWCWWDDIRLGISWTIWFASFWLENLADVIDMVMTVLGILLLVAFFTLCERKSMGSAQRRKGPNRVGFYGVLQPITDGLKLVVKELLFPIAANFFVFICSAFLPFLTAFSVWGAISLSPIAAVDPSAAVPLILAYSSLGIYGIIFAGWASNSKYAFLGGLRAAAQLISYELVISFAYLLVALFSQSFSLAGIVYAQRHVWFLFPLFPVAIVFFIASLAETNRTPFDLPEAESELVAGYNVEYSGILFAFFFLAEYANIALMSVLFSVLFLGGWLPLSIAGFIIIPSSFFFCFKLLVVASFFLWVRAALPRVRYDQLMHPCWKVLLPVELGCLIFYLFYFYFVIAI